LETKKYLDIGSLVVIIITLILFVVALFTKGLTHEILLEAGIFLVSVKLIIMAYKNNRDMKCFGKQLEEMKSLLKDVYPSRFDIRK
jgi:Flp pilus assembly protein TadB